MKVSTPFNLNRNRSGISVTSVLLNQQNVWVIDKLHNPHLINNRVQELQHRQIFVKVTF